MMNEPLHPSTNDLAAFAGGFLPEPEAELIGRHLETCAPCEKRIQDLPADGFLLQLRRLVHRASPAALAQAGAERTPRPARLIDTTSWSPPRGENPHDWPHIPNYKIVAELGRGGMGIVYKAWQTDLERYVAVKVLNRGSDVEDLLRFRTEAHAVARLQHPAIVQIYDVGEQAGRPYLCLEFVDGGNLAQRLAAGSMPAREAAALSCTLAEALHVVHQVGIIHRDLKPANILLSAGGQPKINDFGLAKRLDVDLGHTLSGVIMGTPSYMAPEQARGQSKKATAAADVYSLGATLYEMLTGRPPFKAASQLETLQQVLTIDPVPPRRLQPTVPRDLETICLKCLDKEPSRRYASAAELAADLHRFLDGVPIQARPSSRLERLAKWVRRRPVSAALLGTILVAVAILGGLVASMVYQAGLRSSLDEVSRQKEEVQVQRNRAEEQKARAEGLEADARYTADLYEAQIAWETGGAHVVLDLLDRHRPRGGPDLRGFEWYYLWRLCHLDRFTLRGDMKTLWSLALSPDGKVLAVGCQDGRVHLWNLQRRAVTRCLAAHDRPVVAVAFAPDSKTLATGAQKCGAGFTAIKLWDTATGKALANLKGHGKAVNALAFLPQGKRLLSAGEDGFVRLWDLTEKKATAELRIWKGEAVTSLALSPDGSKFAAGTVNGGLSLWTTATREQIVHVRGQHDGPIWSLQFSPDGELMASAGYDGTVRLWNHTRKVVHTLGGHEGVASAVVFSPSGQTLASGGGDETIRLWDVPTRKARFTLKGHQSAVRCLAFGRDDATLFSAETSAGPGGGGAVKVWDIASEPDKTTLRPHLAFVRAVAFSPDGKWLATGGSDRIAKLHWLGGEKEPIALTDNPGPVQALVFDPVHKTLITGCVVIKSETGKEEGEVRVWDVATGAVRAHCRLPNILYSLALTPDSKMLAVGSGKGLVHFIDPTTGKILARLAAHTEDVMGLAFSPDGKLLATSTGGLGVPEIKLWDVASRQCRGVLKGHTSTVWAVAFSPNGKVLASASGDDTAKLWDVATQKELATCAGHHGPIHALAFDPEGRRLATAAGDKTIKLWDATTGRGRALLRGHARGVWSLAFSPDGKTLASGDENGVVILWRAATEREVGARSQ